jgi:hypothetical protein
MERPRLTRESRCLLIVARGVLERCIEDRARAIAAGRSAEEIAPEDVQKGAAEFLAEGSPDLPPLVQQAMSDFRRRFSEAA